VSPRDDYTPGLAANRYRVLERDRWATLQQARINAALSIPYICPPYDFRGTRVVLPKPNQGLAYRGLSNLTGTFLKVLMPPGMPFFKESMTPAVEAQVAAANDGTLGAALSALSKYEMGIVEAIAEDGDRAGISSGYLHLPVTGNVLLHLLPKGGVRHFGINQFCVRRGSDGTPLETVLAEATRFSSLDPAHQAQIVGNMGDGDEDAIIDIYTHIKRDGRGRVCEYQEAKGVILEDTEGDYPEDEGPWLPLRWNYVNGEDYGRGLVEGIFKDVERFDHLSKAIGDASKNAAKLIWMVSGGGGAALSSKLGKAENGSFVVGDAGAVKALQQEKANDLQVAMKEKESLKADLSQTFLMGTSIQRSGDRVTKFEVEYMAQALQATYANEYTILGREFQLPYFKAKTAQLRRRGVIPSLPKGTTKVAITTGIDALGRGSDQQSLDTLADAAAKISQVPEDMIVHREYLRRSAANLGVKPDGLIPSDDQVAQQNAARMQQQMLTQATPEAVKGVTQGYLQRQDQAFQQEQQQPNATQPSPPQGPSQT
jgi:hypothetical protein